MVQTYNANVDREKSNWIVSPRDVTCHWFQGGTRTGSLLLWRADLELPWRDYLSKNRRPASKHFVISCDMLCNAGEPVFELKGNNSPVNDAA